MGAFPGRVRTGGAAPSWRPRAWGQAVGTAGEVLPSRRRLPRAPSHRCCPSPWGGVIRGGRPGGQEPTSGPWFGDCVGGSGQWATGPRAPLLGRTEAEN